MAFRSKNPCTTCLVCYKEMTQFECNSSKSAHVSICHQSFVKLLGLPATFITDFLKETRLCSQCQEWMVQILDILDELKFVQEKLTSAKKKAISLITYSYLRQKQKENADKLITIADKCDKTREARKRIFDRLGQLGIIRNANANNIENNDNLKTTVGDHNQNKKLPNTPEKFAFKHSIGVQTDSFGPNNVTQSPPVLHQQKQPQFQQKSPQQLTSVQQPKQLQQPLTQQQKPLELPEQQQQQNKNTSINRNPTPNKRPARTYPCPNCSDKIYKTRQGLTLHLNRHHPKPKSKTPPPTFDDISQSSDGESTAEDKRESPLMSPEQVEKLEKQKVDQYLENYLSNKMRAQPSPPPPQHQPTILQKQQQHHHQQQQQQQQPIMNKSSSFQNEFQMFFNPPLQFPSNCNQPQQSPNLLSPINQQQQQQQQTPIWPKKQIIANVDAEICRKRKEFDLSTDDFVKEEIFAPKNLNPNYGTNTNTNINQIQSHKQILSESPRIQQNVIIQNNYNNTTDGSQYHQQPAIYNSNQIINYPSSISSVHSNSSNTSHNQYNQIPPVYQQQHQEIANPMISGQQQEPQIFNNTSNFIFPDYSTPKPSTSPRISLFNNTFNSLVQQHTSMIQQSGQQHQQSQQQNFNHLQPTISQTYANPPTQTTQFSSLQPQQQQFYHNQNRY